MDFKELNISIKMFDKLDSYYEEDIAKNVWPYLTPFLTRRHGVDKGSVNLNDGAVIIEWRYKDNYEDQDDETIDDFGLR